MVYSIIMWKKKLVIQSCPTFCEHIVCSLPGSSVHGSSQARKLEWVAIPFSRVSSRPRDQTPGLPHCRWILYHLSHQGSPENEIVGHSVMSNSFSPHGL